MAGTNMNEASSRSHAIFTIMGTRAVLDLDTGAEGLTTSKVQWAGSNRGCTVQPYSRLDLDHHIYRAIGREDIVNRKRE